MAQTLEFLLLWEPRGLGGQVRKRWALVPAVVAAPSFSQLHLPYLHDSHGMNAERAFVFHAAYPRIWSEGEEVNRFISPISTSPFLQLSQTPIGAKAFLGVFEID